MSSQFKYFTENIFDTDATDKTKLQQVGEFIEYINKDKNLSIDEKIKDTINVLDKVKAFEDGYLKQLPYTSKTTALLTYLLIEKLINEKILSSSRENPFLLCDLTYGYGMQLYWVAELVKRNLLDSKQTFIAMYYDKYFSIGSYYKVVSLKLNGKEAKKRIYFNSDHSVVDNQNIVLKEESYKMVTNIEIKFNKENPFKNKSGSYKKELLDFSTEIDTAEESLFYIIDKKNKSLFKIDKDSKKYQKMAANKLIDFDLLMDIKIFSLDSLSTITVDITKKLTEATEIKIKKLNLDYKIDGIVFNKIEYFDFKAYDDLKHADIPLKDTSNSVYILDLPSNDIISQDNGVADKILKQILDYLDYLEKDKQQIFIISTAKGASDFKDQPLYKGSVKLSGDFMPLTDTSMNLIVLSNVDIDNFEIDLSNNELLTIETDRIFDNKKEIKQKLVMKDVTTQSSIQYEFINQINHKKSNELFATIMLGEYIIINNTLFKKESDKFILVGIISSIDLEESKLIIKLNTDELINIAFKSDKDTIVYKNFKVLFKKYMGVVLKDELYEDLNKKDISDMYKSLVFKLYNEVQDV